MPAQRNSLRQSPFLKAAALALALAGLWLLLSGLTKPLLLMLGAVSVLLVVAIVVRLGILDAEGVPVNLRFGRLVLYSFWLVVEVLKADWAVTKVILSPVMDLRQRLLRVPATTRTELAKVVYANSITLTPGTITVETEGDTFVVHVLNDDAADIVALAAMNDRVCATEARPRGSASGAHRLVTASGTG